VDVHNGQGDGRYSPLLGHKEDNTPNKVAHGMPSDQPSNIIVRDKPQKEQLDTQKHELHIKDTYFLFLYIFLFYTN